jgi:hypothetical protein
MRLLLERGYFALSLALGWLLRSARYSKTRIVGAPAVREVRKRRAFYVPLLIWLSGPLIRLLDTGVRVLPQRDWEEREREIYRIVYGTSIRIDAAGGRTLILPCFAGKTLAALLQDPELDAPARQRAIEWAVVALAGFHRLGFTHGDAMAENVMIDVDVRIARWFDFETVHDPHRSMDWRRADDLRALIATCLIRTLPEKRAEILQFILDVYADERVIGVLAADFSSIVRRSLPFHLAQAAMPFQCFRDCAATLCAARQSDPPSPRAVRARSTP